MAICLDCARSKMRGVSTRNDCSDCAGLKKIVLHERVKKAITDFAEEDSRNFQYAQNSKIEAEERRAIAWSERRNNLKRLWRRQAALRKIKEQRKSGHS